MSRAATWVDTAHCICRRIIASGSCTNFNVDKCVTHVACLNFSLWETGYEKFNVECFLGSCSKTFYGIRRFITTLRENRSFLWRIYAITLLVQSAALWLSYISTRCSSRTLYSARKLYSASLTSFIRRLQKLF